MTQEEFARRIGASQGFIILARFFWIQTPIAVARLSLESCRWMMQVFLLAR